MLDKVVALAVDEGQEGVAAQVLEVDVWTDIPEPHIRLRLWNPKGQDPQVPEPVPGRPTRWRLESARAGCTLTWSVRLASAAHSRFELRLRVFQAGTALPGADFSYSGPLEGLEERSGRFHFTSKTGVAKRPSAYG